MTDHGSYTYDDSDRRLTIREMGGRVDIFVRDLDDSAMVLLPAEQRQAAAQALAGDGYRVVSAQEWKIAYDAGFEAGKKYAQQSQPGTSDRGHAVFQFDATCPKCAKAEAQAAQPDRPEPVAPSEIAKAKAEALREAADAYWDDTTKSLRPSVTQWLHERADRLEQPEPEPEKVRAWTQWLADHGAGRNGVAETLVRAGLEVPDA